MDTDRKLIFSNQLCQVADAICVILANVMAMLTWNFAQPYLSTLESIRIDKASIKSLQEIGSWFFLSVPLTPIFLELLGYYKIRVQQGLFRNASVIIKSLLCVNLFLILYAVFFNIEIHRPFVVTLAFYTFVLLVSRFLLVRHYAKHSKNKLTMKVVIIGECDVVTEWENQLDAEIRSMMDINHRLFPNEFDSNALASLIAQESIERVIVLPHKCSYELVSSAVETCELLGVESWVAVDFVKTKVAKPVFDSFGGRTMLVMKCIPILSWSVVVKAIADRVLALVLLLLSIPFLCLAAIGIKVCSPGPILFSQLRSGQYGKTFKIWKLRTMNVNAEQELKQVKQDAGNDMDGPVFKLSSDPRVFRWGALLRMSSIDELPQLWNVLRGDMSLVGPRPLPVYEVDAFEKYSYRRRLSVKPGITCIWQVQGRSKITSFEEWVAMDLEYIDNWSLTLDLKILLKTVPAVLLQKGAK